MSQIFPDNMTLVPIRCHLTDYPDRYGITDFWWKIHPSKGCCAATLYIHMWGPCEDVFSLTSYQNSLYAAKTIRVEGSLPETFGAHCRRLRNIFTDGSVLSEQTYVPSRIASTCGPSPKDVILSTIGGHQVMGKLLWSGGNFHVLCKYNLLQWSFTTICSVMP